MNVWKVGVLALSLAVAVVCAGCQLADTGGGVQLSRMLPKPDFGSPVPEQHEPDPNSLYGTQSADEEATGGE